LAEARTGLERALALAEEFRRQEILSSPTGSSGYFARCYGDPESRAGTCPKPCESPNAWEARSPEASPIAVSAAFI